MPERPNFLLIFPDQWRWDCLGFLGHSTVETPFLDQLAAEGTTFTAAYSPAPICIPARASLITGQTPSTCGRLGYREGVPWRYERTMMRELRDGGYQTMLVGKTHFYPPRVALGFEELRLADTPRDVPSEYHEWLDRTGGGLVRDTQREISNSAWIAHPWLHPEPLHPSTWTAETAIELLERRDPTRPFFLHLGFHRPHPPYDPPLAWFERFRDVPLAPVPVGDWAGEWGGPVTAADSETGCLPDAVLARTRRAYYAQIAHLDYQIGRVVHWLRRARLLDETCIVFTTDHGEMLGDHHRFRKSIPLEGSAHIPFIVRPPRDGAGPRGGRCDLPVGLADVMPTVLAAAGVSVPETVEGADLGPLVRGEHPPWRAYLHGECVGATEGWQYVTDGREKFFWESVSGREWFFDLRDDPQELHNRVQTPRYAERVNLWRARLIGELARRPHDGLSDGTQLLAGRILPLVRPDVSTGA